MERLRTYITNLDRILKGGIPLYSTNIIAGAPGSGKTILTQHIIFNNASYGAKALYISTISESQMKLIRNLSEFSFFKPELLNEKVIFRDLSFSLRKKGIESLMEELEENLKELKPNILVIDSFKAIRDILNDEKSFRQFTFELAAKLSIWEVTSFLVGEYTENDVAYLCEFAIADGIIYLYGGEEKKFQKRYLRILKMRGTDFEAGQHAFIITSEGIQLFPRTKLKGKELIYNVETSVQTRKKFGIREFDEMLGGGIIPGTSTIIAGATGTGKTAFSICFSIEGARNGEKSLVLSFEETPSQLKELASGIGAGDIDKLIKEEKLLLQFLSPVEIDLDQLLFYLKDLIETHNPQRIVIDSISSLEKTYQEDPVKYRDFIWNLVHFLKSQKLTSILTIESTDPFASAVISKAMLSLIADNIVVLRYHEDEGRIKTVVGVLKTRRSWHSRQLRVFTINEKGIQIEKEKIEGEVMK